RVFSAHRCANGNSNTSNINSCDPWCALGSVKAQIGHTKAAAGVAGLIKATLSLYYKILPPAIKVKAPLAELCQSDSPFYLASHCRPWLSKSQHPRRAGVSAFGFGGSNFHCLLEEYSPRKEQAEPPADFDIFTFSGSTAHEVINLFQEVVENPERGGQLALASRKSFDSQGQFRLIIVAENQRLAELFHYVTENVLEFGNLGLKPPQGLFWGQGVDSENSPYGFIYPTAVSAYQNMFRELACDWPQMIEALSKGQERLAKADPSLSPLSLLLYPPDLAAVERQSVWVESFANRDVRRVATCAINQGLTNILQEFGLNPSAVIGEQSKDLSADGALNVLQELNHPNNQPFTTWLEIGPGDNLSREVAIVLGDKGRVLPLDQNKGGYLDLALFLGQLAGWGLPVNWQAWPISPIDEVEIAPPSDAFTVPISGANYFDKKVLPPSKAPQNLTVQDKPQDGYHLNMLEKMAAEAANRHQEFLKNQADTIRLMEELIKGDVQKKSTPLGAVQRTVAVSPVQELPLGDFFSNMAPAVPLKPQGERPLKNLGRSASEASQVLEIIASETGYPLSMLDLSMNLEGDLGLDSIKKVEIMAALSEKMPHFEASSAGAMGQVTTLGDLVRLADESSANLVPLGPSQAVSPPSFGEFLPEDVWETVKLTVAHETGYPLSMLKPKMNLTNDLGLDSIKLVEIASAISEKFPQAQTVSAELLTGAETLADLVLALGPMEGGAIPPTQ
ncbi:MAG: phosphopantetheine-binding protein, partial [Candidatus Adiutrix sp.]